MTKLNKQIAIDMGFAQLLMHVKDMFIASGLPELANIRENADLMQHVMGVKGAVNTGTVLEYLQELDMLEEEAPAAAAPVVEPSSTPVVEPEEAPAAENEQQDPPPAATQEPNVETEEAPEQGSDKSLVQHSLDFIEGVSQDGKWVRTAAGGYVCPFCVSEGRTDDLFIAETPKSIGPHTRKHEVKDRSGVDALLPTLPPYTEEPLAQAPPEETPEVSEEDANATDREVISSSTDPEPVAPVGQAPAHRVMASTEDPVDVEGGAGSSDLKKFMAEGMQGMEDRVMSRLDSMETVLALAVVSITSMTDEQRQAIFEGYAKHKAAALSVILQREV